MPDHAVAVAVRAAHVLAMALMLGGAVLATAALATEGRRVPRALLRAYEWTFWASVGVAVMTGVGNLGAFGGALPPLDSRWGLLLAAKLGALLALLGVGLLRSLLALRPDPEEGSTSRGARRALLWTYGATAVLLAVMAGLAVVMAHG